jgi:DNA-binding NarL/FixJ family response regulator
MTPSRDALRGVRVLVVEDEVLIAEEIRERLSRVGAVVVATADTGERAVEAARAHRPEVVLMDIRLKGRLDGVGAAEAIRALDDTPVVFLTAHSDRETLSRAAHVAPAGYVLKPFRELDLVRAILAARTPDSEPSGPA